MTAIIGHQIPRRLATGRRGGATRRLGGTAGIAAAVLLAVGPAAPVGLPVPPAAEAPAGTVTVIGSGGGLGALGQRLPSGQALGYRTVLGWGFPPGVQAGVATVAGDGTVLVAGRDLHGGEGPPTAPEMAIGAYQPETGTYRLIRVPGPAGAGEAPGAPSVAGLAPLANGNAVAFTAGAGSSADWPVFGVLTTVDGEWRVAGQWTGVDLRTSGLGELVVLPRSGDLVIAQAAVPGRANAALLALRLAGPGPDGTFTVTVTGRYPYPRVRDPQTGAELDLALRDLHADPTSEPGRERLVVGLRDLGDTAGRRPLVIQELSYDAATGAITPVSAPTIPGDRHTDEATFYGYSAARYDHNGGLWAARHNWIAGGKLAVYTARAGAGGVLDRPECPYHPGTPPEEYRTGPVWGQACRPDYDLVQAQDMAAALRLMQAPAGTEIVALTIGGDLLPVRFAGQGDAMTFEVGNLVETALRLLPPDAGGVRQHQPGALDPAGRLWLPGANAPAEPAGAAEQWLYEVRVTDLFDPPPVPLPDVPGQLATVQAGHTASIATHQVPGAWAAVDVTSAAHLRSCAEGLSPVGCSYDGLPGNGFVLGDRSGFGHLRGEVAYRVEVPVAGRYRVAYRVSTFEVTTTAAITLTVGDQSHTTPVDTRGQWRTVPQAEPIELPAGVHTIRLSPPEGQGGWYLNWFSLQRT